MNSYLVPELRSALRANQVVTLIGARGTGKSLAAKTLAAELTSREIDVIELDARSARRPEDLEAPLSSALRCEPDDLTVAGMQDARVRVIVDNCDAFYDKPWFVELQYRWRALFASPEARGKAQLLIIGRPIFRLIAGGDASPLVNAGPVLVARPMSLGEIVEALDVSEQSASIILRQTGGHPRLASALAESIRTQAPDVAVPEFVTQYEEYVMELVADFELPARNILLACLDANRDQGVDERVLIEEFYGAALNEGRMAIKDLVACGLLTRSGEHAMLLGAALVRDMPSVRLLGRAFADFALEPPTQQAACATIVFEAENRLRRVIVEVLGSIEPTWWTTRVRPELRGRAEKAAREEEASAVDTAPLHPIGYMTLGELFELVFHGPNWDGAFSIKFQDGADATRRRADDLKAVRNKIAHSRPVTEADHRLAARSAELLRLRIPE